MTRRDQALAARCLAEPCARRPCEQARSMISGRSRAPPCKCAPGGTAGRPGHRHVAQRCLQVRRRRAAAGERRPNTTGPLGYEPLIVGTRPEFRGEAGEVNGFRFAFVDDDPAMLRRFFLEQDAHLVHALSGTGYRVAEALTYTNIPFIYGVHYWREVLGHEDEGFFDADGQPVSETRVPLHPVAGNDRLRELGLHKERDREGVRRALPGDLLRPEGMSRRLRERARAHTAGRFRSSGERPRRQGIRPASGSCGREAADPSSPLRANRGPSMPSNWRDAVVRST